MFAQPKLYHHQDAYLLAISARTFVVADDDRVASYFSLTLG